MCTPSTNLITENGHCPHMPMRSPPDDPHTQRISYRHGDLRRALLDAGIELARAGGPGAVVLREATRRAGVAPNAAYRHFASREALLAAVRMVALGEVARSMEVELEKVSGDLKPADLARASLRAVGKGYLRFAQAQPGLFQTAFSASGVRLEPPGVPRTDDIGLSPYKLLSAALDRFVEAGVFTPAHRQGTEALAWSAVHGLALLLIDGPLTNTMGPKEMNEVEDRLLGMVERGLGA
jgi:AcrR family transcriptional regulator